MFFDPNNKIHYIVYNKNLEYIWGRNGGWYVIDIPYEEGFDDEPFVIGDMIIELIANTDQ